MAELEIRAATLADIPSIAQIYRHSVLHGTASFEIAPPDEAEMARRFGAVTAAAYPYLVAVDPASGAILGYAYFSAYRARPAYGNSIENSVYVAEDAHRRGVGRALLAALIDRAIKLGYRQMIAVIGDSANVSSIGLHQSLGFTHCGTIRAVGYKHGRWLDSVIMQRALGLADSAPPQPDRMPKA